MPNVNELLDIAKVELANLLTREVFMIRDLFKGYGWNQISCRSRLLLATLFLNYIKKDDLGIVPIERHHRGRYIMVRQKHTQKKM